MSPGRYDEIKNKVIFSYGQNYREKNGREREEGRKNWMREIERKKRREKQERERERKREKEIKRERKRDMHLEMDA